MIYGLQEKTIQAIRNIFSRFPEVEKVLLYGSRAKGNFRNGSDIDLCMVG
jgi:predicted nucleotidyltransferase